MKPRRRPRPTLFHLALPGALLTGVLAAPQAAHASSYCPVPTMELCRNHDYLDSICGQAQREDGSTCATLLGDDFEVRYEQGVDDGWMDDRMSPDTIGGGIMSAVVEPEDHRTKTAGGGGDTYKGFRERYRVQRLRGDLWSLFSRFLWSSNGDQVASCTEYTFEKYLDVSRYEDAVAGVGSDFRAAVDVAYGPATSEASIGTRHLADPELYGTGHRGFGTMFGADGAPRAKNAFIAMGSQPAVVQLLQQHFSSPLFADDAMLDRVDRATHYEGVTETWAWHDAMRTSMSTMHRRRPVLDGYIQVKTPWGTARMPHYAQDGYADEELDYLHGLQQRLADKVRELLSIQAPPCAKPEVGSPLDQFFWAVDPPYDADAGLFGPYDALGRGAPMSQTDPRYNLLAVGTPVMFDLGGTVSYATPTCNQQIASTGRGAALLEEIGALLTEADTWGCLDSGTTPCDWSPRGFYFATTGGFAEATESTYQTCLQSVPTSTDLSGIADVAWRVPLAPINNCPLLRDGSYDRACRDITRIGDDYSADGHGYTSSTTDLERYFDDAATFRAKLAEFAKAAAERHVRELPGAPLVNPATGKVRPPGHSFSGGDTLGNNYFGLTYAYGTTYSNPGGYAGCSTSSRFASDASTDVRIFDKDFPLLGVHAEAAPAGDSVTVKILGNEVPAEDLVPGAPMNFATPTLSEGASFWFTVLGVPIKVELGLAGQAGVTVAQQATTSCSSGRPTFDVAAQVTPWFGVDGFATAAVDALVVRAGVKGQIAILHGALPFVAGAEVHAKPDAPTEDVFHARAEIGLELSTLSGRIAAFAELGVCPFCTGAEGTIISWQGPAWNEPLASYDYAISLADLDLVFDSH